MGPPLWSSGQSSWLQIQRPGFDYGRLQIWKAVGLKRGPLSLVSTTEELLERKSSSSDLENREYGGRDPSRWPRGTHYPQKLALTSPTIGGRSVDIVRSRTQTTEFFFFLLSYEEKHEVKVMTSCGSLRTFLRNTMRQFVGRFKLKNGTSIFLPATGVYLPDCMESHPRRL
jgi:hypothetical protein